MARDDTQIPHGHATVALGWGEQDTHMRGQIRPWLEEKVSFPRALDFGNVAVLCKLPGRP